MSEYQYYEFRAIDRPLTQAEMDRLRKFSSRAEITASSFTNTYNYGNFRGDPDELIGQYFDAFVYVANWGTHQFMVRIPGGFLDVDTVRAYCDDEVLKLTVENDHIVLDFNLHQEEGYGWIEGESWMPSLIRIRDELMRGDLRALYLGWLASWPDRGFLSDDADLNEDLVEPPVPPGLGKLSAARQTLAEFLHVDKNLIDAAAINEHQRLAVSTTDFAFAHATGNFGFIGALALFALYLLLIWRYLRVAQLARDEFGQLIAIGASALLFFHAFVNIGMNVNLLPVVGIPLPFISAGGTPLVTMLAT